MRREDSEAEQNRFTAYISTAVQRRRRDYIIQAMHLQERECLTDNPISQADCDVFDKVMEELPILMQLENEKLHKALMELNERERQIFLTRELDGVTFGELAERLGIGYKGAAAVYYRALKKIRKSMGVTDSEV